MKTTWNLCIVLIMGLIFVACKQASKNSFDQEAEKKNIQKLLKLENQFLLTQELSLYRQMVACDDSSINIIGGKVNFDSAKSLTDDQIIKLYSFDVLKYTKIDEMIEPIIRFSPDMKIAYIVGQTKFYYETTDSLGTQG